MLVAAMVRNMSRLTVLLLALLVTPSFLHAQNLPACEKLKIEALLKHVGDLKDATFIRNASSYEPATAVRFLRGKWDANKTEVRTARDLIDKVAVAPELPASPISSASATAKKSTAVNFSLPN